MNDNLLIWADKLVNNEENNEYQVRLKKIFGKCKFINSVELLEECIKNNAHESRACIIGPSLAYSLPEKFPQCFILFCRNLSTHIDLFLKQSKMINIIDNYNQELLKSYQQQLQCQEFLKLHFKSIIQRKLTFDLVIQQTEIQWGVISGMKKELSNYFINNELFKKMKEQMEQKFNNLNAFEQLGFYYSNNELKHKLNQIDFNLNYDQFQYTFQILFQGFKQAKQRDPKKLLYLGKGFKKNEAYLYNELINGFSHLNVQQWNCLASTRESFEQALNMIKDSEYRVMFEIELDHNYPHPTYQQQSEIILFPFFQYQINELTDKEDIILIKIKQAILQYDFANNSPNLKNEFWKHEFELLLKPALKKIIRFCFNRIDFLQSIKNQIKNYQAVHFKEAIRLTEQIIDFFNEILSYHHLGSLDEDKLSFVNDLIEEIIQSKNGWKEKVVDKFIENILAIALNQFKSEHNVPLLWADRRVNGQQNLMFQQWIKKLFHPVEFVEDIQLPLEDKLKALVIGPSLAYGLPIDFEENYILFCGRIQRVISQINQYDFYNRQNYQEYVQAQFYLKSLFNPPKSFQTPQYSHNDEWISFRFLLIHESLKIKQNFTEEQLNQEWQSIIDQYIEDESKKEIEKQKSKQIQYSEQNIIKQIKKQTQCPQEHLVENYIKLNISQKLMYFYSTNYLYGGLNEILSQFYYGKVKFTMQQLFKTFSEEYEKEKKENWRKLNNKFTFYRGIGFQEDQYEQYQIFLEQITTMKSIYWNSLTSLSRDKQIAIDFSKMNSSKYQVVFQIELDKNNPHPYIAYQPDQTITKENDFISYHSCEAEIVLFPQFKFKYEKHLEIKGENFTYLKIWIKQDCSTDYSMALDPKERQIFWDSKIEIWRHKFQIVSDFKLKRVEFIIENIALFKGFFQQEQQVIKKIYEEIKLYFKEIIQIVKPFLGDQQQKELVQFHQELIIEKEIKLEMVQQLRQQLFSYTSKSLIQKILKLLKNTCKIDKFIQCLRREWDILNFRNVDLTHQQQLHFYNAMTQSYCNNKLFKKSQKINSSVSKTQGKQAPKGLLVDDQFIQQHQNVITEDERNLFVKKLNNYKAKQKCYKCGIMIGMIIAFVLKLYLDHKTGQLNQISFFKSIFSLISQMFLLDVDSSLKVLQKILPSLIKYLQGLAIYCSFIFVGIQFLSDVWNISQDSTLDNREKWKRAFQVMVSTAASLGVNWGIMKLALYLFPCSTIAVIAAAVVGGGFAMLIPYCVTEYTKFDIDVQYQKLNGILQIHKRPIIKIKNTKENVQVLYQIAQIGKII